MSSPAPESRLGTSVGGRYKILSVLGRGGMGVLYTAEHELTQRRVALKLLLPDRDDLPELRARFLLEARTAAAVRHPNIVDVLDMGVDDDGSPFLAMELLEGTSLDRTLVVEQRLTPERTLTIALPILGALAALHAQGIVHRDVKPSNMFLAASPRGVVEPKLLDFGLARTLSDMRLTRSGMVLGTPLYMSPEQAAGEAINEQTDIWSMGIVLFECLSGELPFTSRESGAIAAQVLTGRVRTLANVHPGLPVPLAHAVDRALRRDLSLRYGSMREFAGALVAAAAAAGIALPDDPDPVGLPDFRAWKSGSQVPSTVAAQTPARATKPAPAPASEQRETAAPGRAARRALVLLVPLVLALATVWLWLTDRSAAPAGSDRRREPAASTPEPAAPVPRASAPSAAEAAPRVTPADVPVANRPAVVPVVETPAESVPVRPRAASARGEKRRSSRAANKPVLRAPVGSPKPEPVERPAFDLESEWK